MLLQHAASKALRNVQLGRDVLHTRSTTRSAQ
jgi:hypothetical protein